MYCFAGQIKWPCWPNLVPVPEFDTYGLEGDIAQQLTHVFTTLIFLWFCTVGKIRLVNIGMTPIGLLQNWGTYSGNSLIQEWCLKYKMEIKSNKYLSFLFKLCRNVKCCNFPTPFKRPPIWRVILLLWTHLIFMACALPLNPALFRIEFPISALSLIDIDCDLSPPRSPLWHPPTGPDISHAGDLWLHRWRRRHGS